jgi:S1/P1 Nuclease
MSLAAGWVSGLSISSAQSSALTWATESNAEVCSVVMPNGVTALESGDLSGTYTTSATPTVRLQIAKQGYRYVTTTNI